MTTARHARRSLVLALLCGVAAACGSDSPSEPDVGDTRVVKADPSFAADIQEIFNRRGCTAAGCHNVDGAAGLDLSPGAAYGELVGVTATTGSVVVRVIPGDADGSYLVIRLEGRQTVGNQMPLGGLPLDNIDLTNVRNWIARGAQQN